MTFASILVRTFDGKVQLIEDVIEVELIPADHMRFATHRDGTYPTCMRVERRIRARPKTKMQVVPIKGAVGTEE